MAQPQVIQAVAQPQCRLIQGPFALGIQGCCGLLGVAMLVLKRKHEVPQRPWIIFGLDVSKQGFGAVVVHFANIGVSILLSFMKGNDSGVHDQCAMYFLNFFIDCTFGVFIVYQLQAQVQAFLQEWPAFKTIGDYGHPSNGELLPEGDIWATIEFVKSHTEQLAPMLNIWAQQLVAFLSCLAANKLLVALIIDITYQKMNAICNFLFGPVQQYPRVELIIVMVCCPGILTMLQFYLFDHILKKPDQLGQPAGHDGSRKPLLETQDTSTCGCLAAPLRGMKP